MQAKILQSKNLFCNFVAMTRAEIINSIKTTVSRTLPVGASVILFGSQARGDNSADSDWDLLILLKGEESVSMTERGRLIFPIYELAAELDIDINPIVFSTGEWDNRNFTPFYKNVLTDGIKIWG